MPVTSLSYVTVTANFKRLDGTAAEGMVEFYTDVQLINTVTNQTVVPGTTSAQLVNGAISVSLPATDDSDFSPTGWTYRVREIVDDVIREYSIALPASPSTLDLADAVPVNPTLVYGDLTEVIQDVVGAMTGFGGSGLDYSYNDGANTVTLAVNKTELALLSTDITNFNAAVVAVPGFAAAVIAAIAAVAQTNTVATSQTLAPAAGTAYQNLTTNGPTVTVTIGPSGMAIVVTSCAMGSDTTAANSYMDFAVSGTTTRAATDTTALNIQSAVGSGNSFRASAINLITGLTPGAGNVFTAKYRRDAGTSAFLNRNLIVIPF